jgi:hypothetical protein
MYNAGEEYRSSQIRPCKGQELKIDHENSSAPASVRARRTPDPSKHAFVHFSPRPWKLGFHAEFVARAASMVGLVALPPRSCSICPLPTSSSALSPVSQRPICIDVDLSRNGLFYPDGCATSKIVRSSRRVRARWRRSTPSAFEETHFVVESSPRPIIGPPKYNASRS